MRVRRIGLARFLEGDERVVRTAGLEIAHAQDVGLFEMLQGALAVAVTFVAVFGFFGKA